MQVSKRILRKVIRISWGRERFDETPAWCLDLECGHFVIKRMPAASNPRRARCKDCEAKCQGS